MKILYVYEHMTLYGGVERIFIEKMNYLVNFFHEEVFFLTYNQGQHPMPFKLNEKVRYTDLEVMTFRSYYYHGVRRLWDKHRRSVQLKKKLRDYILKLNPDIIVTTTIGPIKHLLRLKGNFRLIIESHGGYDHVIDCTTNSFFDRCRYSLQKNRIKKADCLVSLTEGDANLWRTIHHHVVVIPNFIHLNESGSFSTLDNKKVIFAGRLDKLKAIPDIVEIWKLVNKRHPDWRLEMYGKGMYDNYLKEVVEKEILNIRCHPPVPNIYSQMVDCSIFILASYYESFGLVIGEAMSCGLPVVAFNCPFGPAEIITDGKDGFLIENRDKATFANKICLLIENREMRQRMGQAAIKSVQRYRPEDIMPMWKELFESMMV